MSKEIRFKTEIASLDKSLMKQVSEKRSRKEFKDLKSKSNEIVYVIRFKSSEKDLAFEKLERDVDMTILNSSRGETVYMVIHSPGGSVTAYANAAQQIQRLKAHGLKVIAYVDEVAASGGYMMASVCDEIVAQPFAFVGSIGVVSQVPIVEEALNKIGVDYKVYTAGKLKRTVVPTKTPTVEEEINYKEKLNDIHTAFKNHVLKYRPYVNADKLMEGDFYMAQDVVDARLVDSIGDSRSAILAAFKKGTHLYEVKTEAKKTGGGLVSFFGVDSVLEMAIGKFFDRIVSMTHPNENIR